MIKNFLKENWKEIKKIDEKIKKLYSELDKIETENKNIKKKLNAGTPNV